MQRSFHLLLTWVALLTCLRFAPTLAKAGTKIGIFEAETDIGGPARSGSLDHDPARGIYRISGGGENMWSTNDSFHFVWKKVSGDVTLAANIEFPGTGGNPHRKACLIIRQSLDSDSAYADAALHGNGLASLQYRQSKGARTEETQSKVSAATRVRLEKKGKLIAMSVAREGETLQPAGEAVALSLKDPFYVGLGVCAHDKEGLEQAIFSNVECSAK